MCEPAITTGGIVCHSNWNIHICIKLICFIPSVIKKQALLQTAQKSWFYIPFQALRPALHCITPLQSQNLHFISCKLRCFTFHYKTALSFPTEPITAPNTCYKHSAGGIPYQKPAHPLFNSQSARAFRLPAENYISVSYKIQIIKYRIKIYCIVIKQ